MAVAFAVSAVAGPEFFFWINLLLIQIAVVATASVGAMEYTGYRRRFCVASLITLCGFLTWMFLIRFNVETYNVFSLVGLACAYFAGLFAAGAYRSIHRMVETDNTGRVLVLVTRVLSRIIPAVDQKDG